jgi:hypothetical protein
MDSLVEFLDEFDKDPAIAALLPAARDELLRAEITRLTAEVERLTIKGTHTCSDQCQRVTCVLRRDNGRLTVELARLQGDLDAIALIATNHSGWVEQNLEWRWKVVCEIHKIAGRSRAAALAAMGDV